ncbi:MAG: hypothetical protein NZL87_04560, partial [Thermomicrobium sp.]|nr:hypothetical protein [Thermomicrobium sp.]
REKLAVIPDDPAERSQLAAKLWGYPDDPASYSVPVPETVPAELRDPSKAPGLAWFSGVAKELKLPPSVAGELYSRYVDFAAKTAADQEAARSAEAAKQVEAIRQAWGENFERNAAAANQALSAIDRLLEANGHKGPKLVEVLDRAGLSSDPTVVNAMLALSRVFKEDTVAGTVKPQSMAAVDRANELLKRSISMMNDNPEEARRLAKEAAELRLLSQRA